MIYAYLSDEAFAVTGTGSVLNYADVSATGYAVPTDKIMNYFDTVLKKGSDNEFLVQHGMIVDPVYESGDEQYESSHRINRLKIDSANTTNGSVSPTGNMILHFDRAKVTDTRDVAFLDTLTIQPNEMSTQDIRRSKTDRRAQLFNIIEAIYMAHNSETDGSNPYTKAQLESLFETAKQSTYKGYVANSLKLSSTVTKAVYKYAFVSGSKIVIANAPEHDYYDHFEFQYNYGDTADTIVTIKVWLNNDIFYDDYPYSTIIDVLYPCNPSWMLYPESSGGEIQAVIAAAKYKDKQIDNAVTENDHSGANTFTSRYVHPIVGSNSRMSFVVMYKGNVPSSADMRLAVRNALTSETDNYGNVLASVDTWKSILPDLFIDAEFYLIPCYFQRVPYSPKVTIERSIVNYRSLYNKTIRLFPNSDSQKIFDYMELLQAPGHDLYIVAIPVDLGTEGSAPTFSSVLALHPTYQALDSIGTVSKFVRSDDTTYQANTTYYYRRGNSPVYEYTQIDPANYVVGSNIPAASELYVREPDAENNWNAMTYITKEFAQLMANCLAVCIDDRSAHRDDFTESEIGGRKYYTFGCNYIEYHMLSREGSVGVFDATLAEDCEHVNGYIH